MNNDFYVLESKINQLIEQYKNLLSENNQLKSNVVQLQEQQASMLNHFEQEQSQLNKQHNMSIEDLNKKAATKLEMMAEKNKLYEDELIKIQQTIKILLKRLPIDGK